jgi:hypothetical protein
MGQQLEAGRVLGEYWARFNSPTVQDQASDVHSPRPKLPSENESPREFILHCVAVVPSQPAHQRHEQRILAPDQVHVQPVIGFDRLLSAGFTENEVQSLRQQFRILQQPSRQTSGW